MTRNKIPHETPIEILRHLLKHLINYCLWHFSEIYIDIDFSERHAKKIYLGAYQDNSLTCETLTRETHETFTEAVLGHSLRHALSYDNVHRHLLRKFTETLMKPHTLLRHRVSSETL